MGLAVVRNMVFAPAHSCCPEMCGEFCLFCAGEPKLECKYYQNIFREVELTRYVKSHVSTKVPSVIKSVVVVKKSTYI